MHICMCMCVFVLTRALYVQLNIHFGEDNSLCYLKLPNVTKKIIPSWHI